MSGSREAILKQLVAQSVAQVELPEVIQGDWIRYEDPLSQFAQTLRFVGGAYHEAESVADVARQLGKHPEWQSAKNIFSAVPEIAGNVTLDEISDPHDLDRLDFVIYPGRLAVAENGAIWITDDQLRHRVVFFITQFLVLVIDRKSIVHSMHEAYALARPPLPGFGVFISGPSKTADIEQSLVIGAHGCRELQVFVV